MKDIKNVTSEWIWCRGSIPEGIERYRFVLKGYDDMAPEASQKELKGFIGQFLDAWVGNSGSIPEGIESHCNFVNEGQEMSEEASQKELKVL